MPSFATFKSSVHSKHTASHSFLSKYEKNQSLVSYVTDFLEIGLFAPASDWLDSALYIFVRDEYGGPFCKNANVDRIRL